MAKNRPCRNGCDDKNLTEHYASGGCATDYCGGWTESHCRKCGWFVSSCACGSNNGASKISYRAEKTIGRRKMVSLYLQPNKSV